MKNIVNIGCGEGTDEAFFFIKAYKKFLRGSNIFLIDATKPSLEASRSLYQKSFSEDDGINFYFLNYAITDNPNVKTVPFYISKKEPTCGLNSLSLEHAKKHAPFGIRQCRGWWAGADSTIIDAHNKGPFDIEAFVLRCDTVEAVDVEALTINALFSKLNLTCVDRLFVDIEGWDAKVLLDLDMDKYFVPSIHFERSHADGSFRPIETKGPLAVRLLDKFARHQYTVVPHREWNMVAIANYWISPEHAAEHKHDYIYHHTMHNIT